MLDKTVITIPEKIDINESKSDIMANDGTGIISSTCGFILHMLFVALPKDIWRIFTFKRKNIKDQTVVITGGASGIGQKMAEMLSIDEGANVAIIDVDEKKSLETCENIEKKGGKAKYWICDITNEEAMNQCASEIKTEFGIVDIVVCNAAILYFGHMMELTAKQLQRAMDVNLMGTMITIRAFLPDMEKRNKGQIVAIASVAGYFGETYGMAYCPSKFAVRGVMECLQMEMRDRDLNGIICTTVCPWFIRTPMILNMNMRPTSRLLPFMSINRAATQIIDAILKEKYVSFVPFMVGVLVVARSLLTHHMQKAGRNYLNCHYEPLDRSINNNNNNEYKELSINSEENTCIENNSKENILDIKMSKKSKTTPENIQNYFKLAGIHWYIIIVPALIFTFIVWYNPELIPVKYLPYLGPFAYQLGTQYSQIVLWINILAWLAHLGEAIYSLYLSDQIGLTYTASFKWFIQTFIVGFPSLILLTNLKKKYKNLK